jgi:hypothetical protein
MAVAFQAVGTDVATTTTTLALVAPATANDDIIVANIYFVHAGGYSIPLSGHTKISIRPTWSIHFFRFVCDSLCLFK